MKRLSVLLIVSLALSGCATAPTPTLVPVAPATATALSPSPVPAATLAPVPQSTVPSPVRTLYPAPTNPIKATLVHTQVSPLGFVTEWSVDSWFDNPNPPLGSQVVFSGSLLRNGMWSGGIMTARWMQGGEMQVCNVIMIYQRGICVIQVRDFDPGVYVPITYTINYAPGLDFTGYNGFTPTLGSGQ
jgi:hypothetical protein